jgi:hypothetical protein
MVWIRKDNVPSIMPWNMRYDPVIKQVREGQGVLPSNYRPSSNDDVPPGRMCGVCVNYSEGVCHLFAARVDPEWYCDSWEAAADVMVKQEECTCWDGYERVPGTAPCESGSCREIKKHADHDQKSHGRRGGFSGPQTASSVFQQVLGKPEDQRGISINIMGKQPTDGYMVAFQGAWQPVPENEFRDNGKQVIRDYLRKHAQALGGSEKTYMGIWFNTDTRQYEFDLSEQIANKRQAVRVGRTREQEAAWDVKRSEPVFIGARDSDRQAEIDAL